MQNKVENTGETQQNVGVQSEANEIKGPEGNDTQQEIAAMAAKMKEDLKVIEEKLKQKDQAEENRTEIIFVTAISVGGPLAARSEIKKFCDANQDKINSLMSQLLMQVYRSAQTPIPAEESKPVNPIFAKGEQGAESPVSKDQVSS